MAVTGASAVWAWYGCLSLQTTHVQAERAVAVTAAVRASQACASTSLCACAGSFGGCGDGAMLCCTWHLWPWRYQGSRLRWQYADLL